MQHPQALDLVHLLLAPRDASQTHHDSPDTPFRLRANSSLLGHSTHRSAVAPKLLSVAILTAGGQAECSRSRGPRIPAGYERTQAWQHGRVDVRRISSAELDVMRAWLAHVTCHDTRSGRWRRMVALAAVAMMTASCSTSQSSTAEDATDTADRSVATDDPPPPATTRSSIPDGVIEQVACSDNGACANEFRLNGRTYAASCGLVDPAQVDLDNELGQGYVSGRKVRANALQLDPSLAVIAVSAPPGTTSCGEDPGLDAPTSQWQFAFTFTGTADDALICAVGLFSPEEAADHGCDE